MLTDRLRQGFDRAAEKIADLIVPEQTGGLVLDKINPCQTLATELRTFLLADDVNGIVEYWYQNHIVEKLEEYRDEYNYNHVDILVWAKSDLMEAWIKIKPPPTCPICGQSSPKH